ncbi:MAG: helix-turn-helix domain-containing protein [Candidatus Anstonellaceae archaeon]
MQQLEILREAGFSEAESRVYLALLGSGACSAGNVIKKVGLHRATTYQILQRLQEKGAVSSVIDGGRRIFAAASPKRLLDIVREREAKLAKAIPALEAMLCERAEEQDVRVYRGVEGLRTVLNSILEEVGTRGEYCDFGVSGMLREVMGSYWWTWQGAKRKKKIRSYVIFNEKIKNDPTFLKEYYGKCRFYPKEYPSVTDTFIWKDSVALMLWTAKPPIAIVIRSRENAESYRNQFWLLWKQAKKH